MLNMDIVSKSGKVAQDFLGNIWILEAPEYSFWRHVPALGQEPLPSLRFEAVSLDNAVVEEIQFPGPRAMVCVRWGSANEASTYGFVGVEAIEAAHRFMRHGLSDVDFQHSRVLENPEKFFYDTVVPDCVNSLEGYLT